MLRVTIWATIAIAIMLLVLSMRVIQLRLAGKVSLGDGNDPTLAAAIRAQGNLTEYAPLVLIVIGLLELAGAGGAPLIALAVTFVAARILHAVALSSPAGPPSLSRTLGMVGTFGTLTAGAIWLGVLAA